jgi:hypothetical protein
MCSVDKLRSPSEADILAVLKMVDIGEEPDLLNVKISRMQFPQHTVIDGKGSISG